MHKPRRVTFDRDMRQRRRDPPQWQRFTVYICARNMANALRRALKRFPGCRLVTNG